MTARTTFRNPADPYEKVFHALGHPTRRQILVLLQAAGGQMTAGEIAARFAHRWPTVTRHMRILEVAGLVTTCKDGREQNYTLHPAKLKDVITEWLAWFQK